MQDIDFSQCSLDVSKEWPILYYKGAAYKITVNNWLRTSTLRVKTLKFKLPWYLVPFHLSKYYKITAKKTFKSDNMYFVAPNKIVMSSNRLSELIKYLNRYVKIDFKLDPKPVLGEANQLYGVGLHCE
jgi:hypothetical protein